MNCKIRNFSKGICLGSGSANLFYNNTFVGNRIGFYYRGIGNFFIENNTFMCTTSNSYAVSIEGSYLQGEFVSYKYTIPTVTDNRFLCNDNIRNNISKLIGVSLDFDISSEASEVVISGEVLASLLSKSGLGSGLTCKN